MTINVAHARSYRWLVYLLTLSTGALKASQAVPWNISHEFFFQANCSSNSSMVVLQLQNRTFSTVESIFNCDLPGSTCTYYYPAHFFDSECGLGRSFRRIIVEDTQAKMDNKTLWNTMPAIGFPTIRVGRSQGHRRFQKRPQNDTNHLVSNTPLDGENLSFIHIHKAGGSSLHDAFNRLSSSKKAQLTRHRWWSHGGRVDSFTQRQTQSDLKHAVLYPTALPFATEQHVIFAVVRNPVERFISSIGQAFGAPGSQGEVAQQLSDQCIQKTSRETLRCVIHYVKTNSFFVELHFAPQVLDISFTTMWENVPIAIFPFRELPNILTYLGLEPDHKRRDGHQSNYRPNPILTNMTVADYDEDMMRDICQIYKVDVIMQRSLGIDVPQCEPFLEDLN